MGSVWESSRVVWQCTALLPTQGSQAVHRSHQMRLFHITPGACEAPLVFVALQRAPLLL